MTPPVDDGEMAAPPAESPNQTRGRGKLDKALASEVASRATDSSRGCSALVSAASSEDLSPSSHLPLIASPDFTQWLAQHFEKYGKGGAFIPDEKYARYLSIAKSWYENPHLKKGSAGQEGTAKERSWLKDKSWTFRPVAVRADGQVVPEGLWAPPEAGNSDRRFVVPASQVQQVIEAKHLAVGHLKRDKCWPLIRASYVGVPKAAVEAYPLFCPACRNANTPEAKLCRRHQGAKGSGGGQAVGKRLSMDTPPPSPREKKAVCRKDMK